MNLFKNLNRKIKSAILLTIILTLVLAKNILDSNNVNTLGNSFSAFYEDRLLAESYIYNLSYHLYQKKLLVDNCGLDGDFEELKKRMHLHDTEIKSLIYEFEQTKFTELETSVFRNFKKHVNEHLSIEKNYTRNYKAKGAIPDIKEMMDQSFYVVLDDLNQLSNIQVSEGKILNDSTKVIVAGSTLLTQFELAILIVIGLIIQFLIFSSRSTTSKIVQKPHLN